MNENTESQVLVCPTSHLDWDWCGTFAQYALRGTDYGPYLGGARAVVESAIAYLSQDQSGCFSLAEIGFLQAAVAAAPGQRPSLATLVAEQRLELLGGGVTSPDNLVCHGEVFIRNYLVGRRWLRSVGLSAGVAPIAWLPDDFGHDPQLPIVLEAMGMKWVGISRVPGSVQPFVNQPLNGTPSVAEQLRSGGLVFAWRARDGSSVLGHFLPTTYGALWDGGSGDQLPGFVGMKQVNWPVVEGVRTLMATAGGDWARAYWNLDDNGGRHWGDVITAYNSANRTVPARAATISQFMDLVERSGSSGATQSPLLAQNYWTGIFAGRPELKSLHHRSARLILAAEVLSALVRVASTCSSAVLDELDRSIDQAWQSLIPSSHHDYVTGTSPDPVYRNEQLPLSQLAVSLGQNCVDDALNLVARAVPAAPAADAISVVVYNSLGFARSGLVELPPDLTRGEAVSVTFGTQDQDVQVLPGGGLLFAIPADHSVPSFGYTTVTMKTCSPNPISGLVEPSDVVVLTNGLLKATIDRTKAWALTGLEIDGESLLPANSLGNRIRVFRDTGNLYQFGNEPLAESTSPSCTCFPKNRPCCGTFADQGTEFAGSSGEWLENGPLRWHFRAVLTPGPFVLEYLVQAGEPVLRIRLTGAAPVATSVVTTFDVPPAQDALGLVYGTAHHYDDHGPVPYWTGPTFRATHDFAQTTGASGADLAVYHQSVPAWAVHPDTGLIGVLLRNPDGQDRGASGTDFDVHTQEYAIGRASDAPVPTGAALRTALHVTTPLTAIPVPAYRATASAADLPSTASLAGLKGLGILRAARPQGTLSSELVGSDLSPDCRERFGLVLRVYVPETPSPVSIDLPSLPAGADPAAALVTALEEPLSQARTVTVVPGPPVTLEFTAERVVSTVQVATNRITTSVWQKNSE